MAKFHLFEGRNGKYYFDLKAPNGEIICQSQGYVSKQGAERGIAAVKKDAADATIVDET